MYIEIVLFYFPSKDQSNKLTGKFYRSQRSDEVRRERDFHPANNIPRIGDNRRNQCWVAPENLELNTDHPRSILAGDTRIDTSDTISCPNRQLCDHRT